MSFVLTLKCSDFVFFQDLLKLTIDGKMLKRRYVWTPVLLNYCLSINWNHLISSAMWNSLYEKIIEGIKKYLHFVSRLLVCMQKLLIVIIGLFFSFIDITTVGWCHRNKRDKYSVWEDPDDRNNWLKYRESEFYKEVVHVINFHIQGSVYMFRSET